MKKHNKKTILIVEDDLLFAKIIVEIINDQGYQTYHTSTGQATLAWLKENKADLLLIDYSLPDMNASILTSLLSSDYNMAPFIIFTGAGDEMIATDMMKRGARDYLSKDSKFLINLPLVVNKTIKDLENEKKLKTIENNLNQIKTLYKALIDSIHSIFLFFDSKNELQLANKFTIQALGIDQEKCIGQSITNLAIQYPKYSKLFSIPKQYQNCTEIDVLFVINEHLIKYKIKKLPIYDEDNNFLGTFFINKEIVD